MATADAISRPGHEQGARWAHRTDPCRALTPRSAGPDHLTAFGTPLVHLLDLSCLCLSATGRRGPSGSPGVPGGRSAKPFKRATIRSRLVKSPFICRRILSQIRPEAFGFAAATESMSFRMLTTSFQTSASGSSDANCARMVSMRRRTAACLREAVSCAALRSERPAKVWTAAIPAAHTVKSATPSRATVPNSHCSAAITLELTAAVRKTLVPPNLEYQTAQRLAERACAMAASVERRSQPRRSSSALSQCAEEEPSDSDTRQA